MARICITGSSDGLGLLAAQSLLADGHDVILHARDSNRADDVRTRLPLAQRIVTGDLAHISGMRRIAEQVNAIGRCDAVIHNAGVYGNSRLRSETTAEGLPVVFAVNVLAPYVLTALIERPPRLVYLSSEMHLHADADLSDIAWQRRRWSAAAAYSESKLWLTTLAFAVARRWSDTRVNAVDPGWVPTKMGGASATDDLDEGYRTQAWLAVSDDPAAVVSGQYFYHYATHAPDPRTRDKAAQNTLVDCLASLSGIVLDQ